MAYRFIKAESRGAVREVTLADPATLNALSPEMLAELRAEFATVKSDESLRAMILTGEGRGFSSGANLVTGVVAPGAVQLSETLERHYHPTVLSMRGLGKPIVCAVNGVAAGAGLSLALACDFRIAAVSAKFIQVFVRIGVMPDTGSTWFLPRLIGPERAAYMAMTGEAVDARTAVSWGLALEAVEDAGLMEKARALAVRLAGGPTVAIGKIKFALQASSGNSLGEQLMVEAGSQQELGRTSDFAEGVKAFLEKRKAVFRGK